MAGGIDKKAVVEALRARVVADLDAAITSQRDAQEGATHEEARPEGDKDTRAVEASYVARGLAQRVADLQQAASLLANMIVRRFAGDDGVAVSALVTCEDGEGAESVYFVAPAGGGVKLELGGRAVGVITPGSPLARAMLGKRPGDELALRGRELTIRSVT